MVVTAAQAREIAQDISAQQTRIVPTGKNQPWLDARLAMDKEGNRMPTNADYDRVLVGSEAWKQIKEVFPAWSDTVLVYPEKGGKFKAGKDVTDAFKDGAGNTWVFSASSVPKEAVGKKGVAICIEHPKIELIGSRVVLSAGPESSVTLLENFIQENGMAGKVDEKTRVPLEANMSNLSPEQIRWLYRIYDIGVRPLVRGFYGYDVRLRRVVYAIGRLDLRFGVAQLETGSEAAAPKIGTANTQLASMVRETLPPIIAALEPIAKPEVLENLRRLQRVASE